MVDIKVTGPAAAQGTDKKKAASRPTGGPAFASLLDDAADVSAPAPAAAAGFIGSYIPLTNDDDDNGQPKPRKAKQQAHDLLENLQTLAEDVLAGQASGAATKLEAYLHAEVTDKADLSPAVQQALDELSTRAAVAAAKVKG